MIELLLPLWLAATADHYAGARACARCHPAQFASQSATGHARALLPALTGGPQRWAFGAGAQAITFVRRVDPEHYLEEPETWYRAIDGYARTPGHKGPDGVRDRIFDPAAAILRCFACHSTGPLRVLHGHGIVPHEMGIRCEACHGPAAAHARNPEVRPRNPARMSADAVNRLCGECHRMPVDAPDEAILRNSWNARHQPAFFSASRCFRESGGRLSCLSCHRPHEPLTPASSSYDAVCSECHAEARHPMPTAGRACVACHMPAVEPQMHLRFSNHRIAVYGRSDPLVPLSRRR